MKMKTFRPVSVCRASPRPRRRGSVLLTALIFSAIIGLVALPSYLVLSRDALKLSHRGFYNIAVVDLVETGLEHALWAVNSKDWSGWDTTSSAGNARRRFTGFDYSGGATGQVWVHVNGYSGPGASAIAKARITLPSGEVLEKWARVTMKGRSLFAYGLLVREKLTASGGAYFDSWISDPDNNPATPAVAYGAGVARSNAPIASASTATPSIDIGTADIYGTVAVGANTSAGLAMSWGGQAGPRGMPISGSYNVATGALKTGFTASFEKVVAPTGATVVPAYTLPYNKSVQKTNGHSTWNENVYMDKESIGVTGAATILQLEKLTVQANATLTIKGDVTLIMPGAATEAMKVGGSGKILLENNATLKIYTPGSIDISGAGIANSGAPANVQIWGTRSSGSIGQEIKLAGSGALNAVVYAPEAELTMPGGTHFGGAAVVRTAKFTGSGAFHYDESLKNTSFGNSGAAGVESYSELDTPGERSSYATLLAF